MFVLRYERPEDISGIHKVHEAAFGTKAEADLVDTLRNRDAHIISIIAIEDTKIIGHILFSPVTIENDGSFIPVLGLAPMAVLPEYQRKGVGSKLVEMGLDECLKKDCAAVIVLGHPEYYPRFGFTPSVKYNIRSEYDVPPEVFMVKELRSGALTGISGIAKYHEAFAEL